MDLTNLALAGLVFGQALSPAGFNPSLVASGVFFYFGLWLAAMLLRE